MTSTEEKDSGEREPWVCTGRRDDIIAYPTVSNQRHMGQNQADAFADRDIL